MPAAADDMLGRNVTAQGKDDFGVYLEFDGISKVYIWQMENAITRNFK
jgi:hypothetical protein